MSRQQQDTVMRTSKTVRDRFEEKIRITPGCWIWGSLKSGSYGRMLIEGRSFGAHRISYELYVGPIPDGMMICHSCDNPSCVNPDHLWPGTAQQNMDDKMQKGRWGDLRPGELHPLARLTNEDIYAIRADKRPQNEIAAQYNVSRSHICLINLRGHWPHLPKRSDEIGRKKHKGKGVRESRITYEQQLAIRADTRIQRVIGAAYGVSQAVISKIKLGHFGYAKLPL